MAPERFPLTWFTLKEGTKMRDRVGSIHAPTHPAPAESLADDRLTARFHRTRADLPAFGLIRRVVHSVRILADILRHQAIFFQGLGTASAPIQCLQRFQHG